MIWAIKKEILSNLFFKNSYVPKLRLVWHDASDITKVQKHSRPDMTLAGVGVYQLYACLRAKKRDKRPSLQHVKAESEEKQTQENNASRSEQSSTERLESGLDQGAV